MVEYVEIIDSNKTNAVSFSSPRERRAQNTLTSDFSLPRPSTPTVSKVPVVAQAFYGLHPWAFHPLQASQMGMEDRKVSTLADNLVRDT